MREIKFRAWDTTKDKWLDQDHVLNMTVLTIASEESIWEVSQYTGMKDCKGNDIYQGDILGYRDGEFSFNATVDYSESEYYLDCFQTNEGASFEDFDYGGQLEIIGNIYENPELLEGWK